MEHFVIIFVPITNFIYLIYLTGRIRNHLSYNKAQKTKLNHRFCLSANDNERLNLKLRRKIEWKNRFR